MKIRIDDNDVARVIRKELQAAYRECQDFSIQAAIAEVVAYYCTEKEYAKWSKRITSPFEKGSAHFYAKLNEEQVKIIKPRKI